MQGSVQVTFRGDLETIMSFLRQAPQDTVILTVLSPPITLSDELKLYLVRHGMTNSEFADRVEVDKSTVGRIINQNKCSRFVAAAVRRYIKDHP